MVSVPILRLKLLQLLIVQIHCKASFPFFSFLKKIVLLIITVLVNNFINFTYRRDPALMRSGRLDRKIELPNPNEDSRLDILKIHSRKMNLMRGIDLMKIAK